MSYSVDLREKVVSYIEEGGKKSVASKLFKIARSTINEWFLRKKEKGSLNPNEYPRQSEIDEAELIKHIKLNTDTTQKECALKFKITQSGISRAFKRLKITRKKSQLYIKSVTKKSVKNL
jgi:putative transposase